MGGTMLVKFVSKIDFGRVMSDGTCKATVCYNEVDSEGPARSSEITIFVKPDPAKTVDQLKAEAHANAEAYMTMALKARP